MTILLSSGLNSSCAIGRRESASVESDELIVNTGVPLECVPSPVLFSVYTKPGSSIYQCLAHSCNFTDDMTLTARLQDENSFSEYFLQLDV